MLKLFLWNLLTLLVSHLCTAALFRLSNLYQYSWEGLIGLLASTFAATLFCFWLDAKKGKVKRFGSLSFRHTLPALFLLISFYGYLLWLVSGQGFSLVNLLERTLLAALLAIMLVLLLKLYGVNDLNFLRRRIRS
jgi:hypothetical protein